MTSDGIDSLIALSQGDMRRALNILQVRKVRVLQISDETAHSGRCYFIPQFLEFPGAGRGGGDGM